MIIRDCLAIFINAAAENRVCQRITTCFHITSTINEMMWMLGSDYGVQHNRQVTAGRILHTNRDIHTAGSQTMLLVFYGTCTDCFIRKNIIQVAAIFRIEHFICRRKTGFLKYADMHFADCNDSGKEIRCLIRIRLMEHSLVAITGSSRLVCIYSWDDH